MARTIEQAKKLIESLMPLQENPPEDGYIFPCPRCGHDRMDKNPIRNALSRRANVYICNECGTEEALMDIAGKEPLPLSELKKLIRKQTSAYKVKAAESAQEEKEKLLERLKELEVEHE